MKTEKLINRIAKDYARGSLEGMGVEDFVGDLKEIAEAARADERERILKGLDSVANNCWTYEASSAIREVEDLLTAPRSEDNPSKDE